MDEDQTKKIAAAWKALRDNKLDKVKALREVAYKFKITQKRAQEILKQENVWYYEYLSAEDKAEKATSTWIYLRNNGKTKVDALREVASTYGLTQKAAQEMLKNEEVWLYQPKRAEAEWSAHDSAEEENGGCRYVGWVIAVGMAVAIMFAVQSCDDSRPKNACEKLGMRLVWGECRH